MLYEEDKKEREERLYKEPIYRSVGSNCYCIFRIGRKYKILTQVQGFVKHMERLKETPNANPLIKNEILVGDKDLVKEVQDYIRDCRYVRQDTVIGRELLLTASPSFFRGLPKEQFDRWVQLNISWLKREFKDNLKYAVLHLDETTAHIHAFICPKIYSDKRKAYILSNRHYFNGMEKLIGWQDNYAEEMQTVFKSLQRGIRFSKAKHINIKEYYALINSELNENDLEQIKAKAIKGELLEIKIKALQKTLEAYRKYNTNALVEKEELSKDLKKLEKDNQYYKRAVKVLSKHYKIDEKDIEKMIKQNEKSLSR